MCTSPGLVIEIIGPACHIANNSRENSFGQLFLVNGGYFSLVSA